MTRRLWLSAALLAVCSAAPLKGQVEGVPAPASGQIHVTYTEPSDQGQAERLRELAARLKPLADPLNNLDKVEIVVVHTQRELDQRLGSSGSGALTGVSYVHGILFLSPVAWQRNPTAEAIEHELQEALVRYAALRLAGGNPLPDWLDQGLVSVLTKRLFAPASAEFVVERGPLLLIEHRADDPAIGYWAVRYLVEARGGLTPLRQLLSLLAQRPDSFVENLQLVYGVSVGELERDWRRWLAEQIEADRKKRESGAREGPLVKDRE